MRIYIHTSFCKEEFRPEYCFTLVLGGLGGLRGDVTGVGKPSADLNDSPADAGNLKMSAGASHYEIRHRAGMPTGDYYGLYEFEIFF